MQFDESVAALDFGNDFVVQPSYTAACEIDQGGLFRTPGAIVRTSDADYLVASASGWRDLFYCNIQTGVRGGEPGRARVAFASWSLYASGDDEAALIACNVKSN